VTVAFAEVVFRLPPASGRLTEVRIPLGRRPFTAREARDYVADTSLIRSTLARAAWAHVHDNPVALLVAVRLLHVRPDLRWPMWVSAAVLARLETGGPPRPARRIGRHADPVTQWLEDAADYTRYRAVELLTRHGGKRVHAEVAEHLHGFAGAGDTAIRKAHKRVTARIGRSPTFPGELLHAPRYFPDILALHLLAAADHVLVRADRAQTP
jgi:hypothetical protein